MTIVLPFLDEMRFLEGAVSTVHEQTLVEWELIMIDDGSTDGSERLADRLAAADAGRIRVLRHADGGNHGLPASRNLGLAAARAPTVAFLDADDRWQPDKLVEQVEILDGLGDVGMTCSPTLYQHVDDARADEIKPVSAVAPHCFRVGAFSAALIRCTIEPPPPSNVLFRTSALRSAGGVPAGDNLYEDQRTFYAVNLVARVHVSAEPLSTYTVRGDSLYGSLTESPEVRQRQREDFERWTIRWGRRHGAIGLLLAAHTVVWRAGRHLSGRVDSWTRKLVPARCRPVVRTIRRRIGFM